MTRTALKRAIRKQCQFVYARVLSQSPLGNVLCNPLVSAWARGFQYRWYERTEELNLVIHWHALMFCPNVCRLIKMQPQIAWDVFENLYKNTDIAMLDNSTKLLIENINDTRTVLQKLEPGINELELNRRANVLGHQVIPQLVLDFFFNEQFIIAQTKKFLRNLNMLTEVKHLLFSGVTQAPFMREGITAYLEESENNNKESIT